MKMVSTMRGILSGRFRLSRSTGFGIFLFLLLIIPSSGHAAAGPDLTIFFSSDTRGMIRRCGCTDGQLGGLSARASYIKSHRNNETLVLDAGDTLFDGLDDPRDREAFYDLKASVLFKAMKISGYDAILPGEYDLEFGLKFLKKEAAKTGNRLICANLATASGQAFPGSIVKKVGKVTVGITGVVDDKFPYATFPSIYSKDKVADALIAARREVLALRKKADVVVVLAHLDVSNQEDFARKSGADVVIFGDDGGILKKPLKYGNTIVVKGFYEGKLIGRLDLWLGHGGKKIKSYRYKAVRLGEDILPDPDVEELLARYRQELKEKKFAFTDMTGLKGYFAGPDMCGKCHAKSFHNWSSTKHARAFSALVNTGDQYDPECLPCHVTGYGYPGGYGDGAKGGRPDLRNVTCEDCHGAGGLHYNYEIPGNYLSPYNVPSGHVKEKVCTRCHDDYRSPNFDFNKYKQMGGAHRGNNGP